MPAKKQVYKADVLQAAVEIAREKGIEKVNTSTLVQKMGCSTQPIYDAYKSMAELKAEVAKAIEATYEKYLEEEVKSGKYPLYKGYGMGYIRFAREEKEFFRYLFLRDRRGERIGDGKGEMREILEVIRKNTGLSEEEAYKFHIEMWIYVHGIATMLATSYLDLNEETVSELISDAYAGLRLRYKTDKEEEKR